MFLNTKQNFIKMGDIMATPKSQRIVIWIILVAMVIGAVGVYFVAILANNNDQAQQLSQQQVYDKYMKEYEAYQAKVDAQGDELSGLYYEDFSQYATRVSSFDAESANTTISSEDLKVGDGEIIDDTTTFAAYYIGWNPSGKIFDQSIDGQRLKAPLPVADGLMSAGLITGWKEGMKGMRIGGVRLLTIPASQAYGAQGSGEDIPANSPIRFVVMAISLPEQFAQPSIPQQLMTIQ
ncbi:hypothetical protein EOL73_00520 [Candidatus Saccharibacteria bacterium]|nr:hypothetical protein [Candidatus Saccharibacteria bacterium]NCU40226.1 hypothetical protein [Candidatus Saccharibacteria bacterium]